MSYNTCTEENDVIDNNQNLDKNNSLLFLLETADNLEDFCNSCVIFIAELIEVKNIIVCQHLAENEDEIEIIYDRILMGERENKLEVIKKRIKDELILNSNYNCYSNFPKNEEQKSRENIYIIPLIFKKYHLGYLYIETESNKRYLKNKIKEIHTIAKYITLYLYNQTLEEKQETLKKEEERLKENQRNQSQYISHMNHELRTPIAAVIGFAKILQQRLYGDLNPKQAQYIDAIYQSGTYLLELISDLLDISKIQAGKEELFIEQIFVYELCESSLALIKTKADEKNLNLNLEISSDISYCFADQRRIKQILVNLLSNAVKFTEKGSVTLEVTKEKNNLIFQIIDTGIGIDKESQSKLFKPFSQLQTHLQKKHRGSGLGLVISRELARLHGGDITLTSEKNQGSCFTFYLPMNLKPSVIEE